MKEPSTQSDATTKARRILRSGDWIRHFDEDSNGHTIVQTAEIVRARGLGVLVVRDAVKYSVPRSDVL